MVATASQQNHMPPLPSYQIKMSKTCDQNSKSNWQWCSKGMEINCLFLQEENFHKHSTHLQTSPGKWYVKFSKGKLSMFPWVFHGIILIFRQHCSTFYPQCLQEHLQHVCIFISSEYMQRAILSQCTVWMHKCMSAWVKCSLCSSGENLACVCLLLWHTMEKGEGEANHVFLYAFREFPSVVPLTEARRQ